MTEEATNDRSDIKAKEDYKKELEQNGYTAEIINRPADIKAEKDGQTWYFEIKKTKHTDKCFGSATMTEWHQALEDPEHFKFVIAIEQEDGTFKFNKFSPDEFQLFSTIPPFKVYFSINFKKGNEKLKRIKDESTEKKNQFTKNESRKFQSNGRYVQ